MTEEIKVTKLDSEEAKRLLQESEKRYRLIAENAGDVIWTVDMNMQLTYISPSITRLLGYTVEEAKRTRMEDVYTNDSFKFALKTLAEEVESEKRGQKDPSRSRKLELELNHKDGSIIPFEVIFTFVRDADGKPVEILAIAREVTERKESEKKIIQSYEKTRLAMKGIIEVISSIVELKDPYTSHHQFRVTKLACAIAEEIGLPREQIELLRSAALVHDIGKINIPVALLTKSDPLSVVEFSMIKSHSKTGYDILKQIDYVLPVAEIVLQHHERINGTGYPSGLRGEQIRKESKILAVADIVEASSSLRPYREGRDLNEILREIIKDKGILYDPEAVDACLSLFNKGFTF